MREDNKGGKGHNNQKEVTDKDNAGQRRATRRMRTRTPDVDDDGQRGRMRTRTRDNDEGGQQERKMTQQSKRGYRQGQCWTTTTTTKTTATTTATTDNQEDKDKAAGC